MSNRITMELAPDEVELLKAYRKGCSSDDRYLFAYSIHRILGNAAPIAKAFVEGEAKRILATEDPEQTRVINFKGGIRR